MIAHIGAGQLAALLLWFGWLLCVLAVAVLAVTRAPAEQRRPAGPPPPLVLVGPAVVVVPAELADRE